MSCGLLEKLDESCSSLGLLDTNLSFFTWFEERHINSGARSTYRQTLHKCSNRSLHLRTHRRPTNSLSDQCKPNNQCRLCRPL